MVRDLKPKREPQLGSAGSGLPILLGSVGTDAARLKSEDKEDVKLKFKVYRYVLCNNQLSYTLICG